MRNLLLAPTRPASATGNDLYGLNKINVGEEPAVRRPVVATAGAGGAARGAAAGQQLRRGAVGRCFGVEGRPADERTRLLNAVLLVCGEPRGTQRATRTARYTAPPRG